jgi:hypothetical protein
VNLNTLENMAERYRASGRTGMVLTVEDVSELVARARRGETVARVAEQVLRAISERDLELTRNHVRVIRQIVGEGR